ncbi:hypothetical protein NDU88_006213 [Pleurodeles waltl]|uniref:Uncharacterized protein n=1 Tax=Pleurodeles waltl TaxID=8319 RepID=A0AAV7RQK6_PLEWA|nr:hypothetical protein NDU88_006213 [Pleurodeles waltl]
MYRTTWRVSQEDAAAKLRGNEAPTSRKHPEDGRERKEPRLPLALRPHAQTLEKGETAAASPDELSAVVILASRRALVACGSPVRPYRLWRLGVGMTWVTAKDYA